MDAARRDSLLHKRYVEPQLAAKHRSDQETWEAQQAAAASLHFGARDKSGASRILKRRIERVRKIGPDGKLHEVEVVVEEEDLSQRNYELVYAGISLNSLPPLPNSSPPSRLECSRSIQSLVLSVRFFPHRCDRLCF